MSKYRVDSPAGTPLDPYAFEKSIAAPNYNNPSPFSSVASSIELATPEKIDEGYGTMGNASYAVQAINEAKARDQGTLELVAKGVGNVARTIAVEAGKTPGYFGGVLGAIGNEIAGDGKNSMSYIVDNAWVKAFNGLDKSVQDMMPVYISQQVQEGNLWDKLGSGGWWATTGANGVGFMLSMFLPGMAAKALGVGEKIAAGTEALANVSTRWLGKAATGESWVSKLGLMTAPDDAIRTATELASKLPGATEESVALAGKLAGETAQIGYKYTKEFARNANGVSSAILNTTLEASAEAANTFENLTNTYMQQGMSEEEAKQKAGEGAAAVFKGNLALLTVSNLLDEAWLWKSFGSAGEKEAAKSLLEKVTKNGVVDLEELKRIPKEFTRASVLKKTGGNFLKNVLKEGVYEEGTQTTLQQNIEKGKIAKAGNVFTNVLDDLYNVGASYLDDFSNNTELHESVFLGGLLGGGASIFSTIRENNDLKKAYSGGEARTKDNSIFTKYGILPETKAQKGILAVLGENHIKQFRTYKDLLDKTEDGKYELNEKKVTDANLEQIDSFRTNVLYDLAVQNNDKLGQEIYGQFLAADYVHGFLGQEGSKEMFEDHVDNHVLPAWQKRFEETFGRPATEQESAKYIQNFKQSGNRVIDAYTQAEQTNYPERYFHEKTKQYQDFKNKYFHDKFETLVLLDSIASRRAQVQEDLVKAGVTEEDLQNLSKISNPVKRQNAEDIRDEIERLNVLEQKTAEKYKTFYTKEGVKDMFDKYKKRVDRFNEEVEELKEQNKELKKKVDAIPQRNADEITRLQELARSEGHEDDNVSVRNKSGKLSTIEELKKDPSDITEKGFELDDVSKSEYDSFKNTGEASQEVLKKITEKLTKSEPLSKRESEIYEAEKPKVQALLDAELTSLKDKVNPVQSLSEEDNSEKLDKVIDEVDDETRKKGVNLYPSTGRNLLSQLVPYKGNFVEAMIPKASQQLWFQVLDEEVSKDPTKYTVKVVRRDDKSNRELHEQIKEVSEEGNSNPTDLYVVLYKDGKPVIKGGKSNSVPKSPRATDEESIRLSQQWVNETFDKLQTLAANGPIEIFSNQKTYTLKPVFNGFIIEFEGQTLLNSTKRFNKNDIKMWFGEGFDIPNSTKGNYVFTGLWRPNTLYPVKKDGVPGKFVLAKRIVVESFLIHLRLKDLDLNKLSQNQKDTLTKAGVTEFTEDGIATAAFFYAKDDYTKWYNSLVENPGFLNINGITNGHRPKVYSDPKGENPVWGKPLEGIKGLRLDGNRLVGGKLELSTKGTVKTGTGEYNVPIGSTVLIDDQHHLHPMRARNLTQDEMRTVAYLLSLRSQSGPTESIMVSAPGKIQFGTEVLKKVPVFFAEASKNLKGKTRANIIESLISFGHKDGMKGEMYWNKETLDKDPVLVYTDFDGVTKNIAVSKIKDAVDNEKFEDIQDFMNFLAQKRFNVNNQLLGTTQTSAIFSKPKLTYKVDSSGKRVPDLDWDQSRSYFDHLLNDVLTTTTQKIDGYPARAQRNLYFDPKPIPQIVLDSQSEKIEPVKEATKEVVDSDKPVQTNRSKKEALAKLLEEKKNKRKDLSDYADKVLTTDELIKQKLQNGEIIKNCK